MGRVREMDTEREREGKRERKRERERESEREREREREGERMGDRSRKSILEDSEKEGRSDGYADNKINVRGSSLDSCFFLVTSLFIIIGIYGLSMKKLRYLLNVWTIII